MRISLYFTLNENVIYKKNTKAGFSCFSENDKFFYKSDVLVLGTMI